MRSWRPNNDGILVHCDVPGCLTVFTVITSKNGRATPDEAVIYAIRGGWGSHGEIDVCPKHVGTPEAEDLVLRGGGQ